MLKAYAKKKKTTTLSSGFFRIFSDPQNQGLAIRRLSNWQIIHPRKSSQWICCHVYGKTVTEKHIDIFVSMKLWGMCYNNARYT